MLGRYMIFVIYVPISSAGFEKLEGNVVTIFYSQYLIIVYIYLGLYK